MAFIQIGNEYYNEVALGKLFTTTKMDEETQQEITLYYVQYLGGQDVELTQEEYNKILGE